MGEQPPGAPPEQWVRREDTHTRKIIARVDGLKTEIALVKTSLEHHVSHRGLLLIAGSFAVIVVSAVWILASTAVVDSRKAADVAAAMSTNAVQELRGQVEENKQRSELGLTEVQMDVRGLYNYLLTRQRQPRLESQIEAAP